MVFVVNKLEPIMLLIYPLKFHPLFFKFISMLSPIIPLLFKNLIIMMSITLHVELIMGTFTL